MNLVARCIVCFAIVSLATAGASAEPEPKAASSAKSSKSSKSASPSKGEEQHLSGMSIVGNDEAPKSLAIVPWKGSQLGETLNALKAMGAGREPVDKDVFMRELTYYELRAGSKAPTTGPAKVAQP